MRRVTVLDPLAELLLGLRRVSPSQWLLRLLGAGGTLVALALTVPSGPFATMPATVLTLCVAVALIGQLLAPDTALGILGPLAILLGLAALPDLTLPRAAGVGFALLLSHAAFALAAALPVHGEFDRSAWLLWLRGLLPVLALSAVCTLVVVVLAGFRPGPWMLVVGVAAVVMLLVVLLPRRRSR